MKTLVIIGHPDIEASIVNKKWIEEMKLYPDLFTIHELEKEYPDGVIDIKIEQSLIESHGNLVLQFPVHWFNCPPILKKWLDEVFTDGWAFGKSGDNLKDRKMALGVTTGSRSDDYDKQGRYKYNLKEVLVPFEITAKYCKADYQSFFAFYGTDFSSQDEIDKSAKDYVDFLKKLI
ncbi:NAD(P)H-dependent oxidoreductase [Alkalicoccobacillus plakortidis]|uniref:NAD(P)H-dependent oxidoreductase n=1 Tax=Alkalicoccobacillus plakortidis TaxID=444060 RepID=A0ABT0XNK1_9BACI|nr:NAD(P)H-dependent oxidoreductase [Alkalicoccobacillus plakortidis]MCM2677479.1 NAD(P)H-dependent oxidoreductase [Alkalicoccobacillus plakortidis]